MSEKSFLIESFPMERSGRWVVLPSEDREEVQVRLDLGGGDGPVVAEAEWVPAKGIEEGSIGFLCWHIEGDSVFAAPNWAPTTVVRSVQMMAMKLHEWQKEEGRKEA